MIEFETVKTGKKRFLPLLLMADEQESMIDRYLERGELIVMKSGETAVAVAVVTEERNCLYEIKNLAVAPGFCRQGYGRKMIDFICRDCIEKELSRSVSGKVALTVVVGTGDSPLTVPFYEKCGFRYSHTVKGFFTDNYDHPVIDGGKLLDDMLYFKKEISSLQKWPTIREYLRDTCLTAQDNCKAQLDYYRIKYCPGI